MDLAYHEVEAVTTVYAQKVCRLSFHQFQHAPPKSWEEFEDLNLSLWKRIWGDSTAQKNGRSGQPQHGTDVWGKKEGAWRGVQCKKKGYDDRVGVTKEELAEEVAKARKFEPKLSHWCLVTTAPKDARIEEEARATSEGHAKAGLFEVRVLGWEDLVHLIGDYDEVIDKHFPDAAPTRKRTASQVNEMHSFLLGNHSGGSRAMDIRAAVIGPSDAAAAVVAPLDTREAERLAAILGDASSTLLNWPTLTRGHWFERPELLELSAAVRNKDQGVTVLLGAAGTGKSAALAHLGHHLLGKCITLLALKADALPRDIASLADLDRHLDVPEPLDQCLARLAEVGPVALLAPVSV